MRFPDSSRQDNSRNVSILQMEKLRFQKGGDLLKIS